MLNTRFSAVTEYRATASFWYIEEFALASMKALAIIWPTISSPAYVLLEAISIFDILVVLVLRNRGYRARTLLRILQITVVMNVCKPTMSVLQQPTFLGSLYRPSLLVSDANTAHSPALDLSCVYTFMLVAARYEDCTMDQGSRCPVSGIAGGPRQRTWIYRVR